MPSQTDLNAIAASPADLMAPVPVPRRVKPGRHAAPTVKPQLLPGLLLVSAGAAFAGLAALPASTTSSPLSSATTDTLAVGGPDPFADLTVAFKPPLPKPVVQAKVQTKRAATPPTVAVEAAPAPSQSSTRARASRSTARLSILEFVRPCSGVLTSGFGQRWGRLHAGLDFGAPTGTPIRAVAAGVVKEIKTVGQSGGYGNLTILEHEDGTITYYGHQSKFLVSEGETVLAGETIGLVGSTGNSTGPHLHFEVHPDGGGPIDPRPWLRERGIIP